MSYANSQIKDIQIMMHMSVSKTQFNSVHYKTKLTFDRVSEWVEFNAPLDTKHLTVNINLCMTKKYNSRKIKAKKHQMYNTVEIWSLICSPLFCYLCLGSLPTKCNQQATCLAASSQSIINKTDRIYKCPKK